MAAAWMGRRRCCRRSSSSQSRPQTGPCLQVATVTSVLLAVWSVLGAGFVLLSLCLLPADSMHRRQLAHAALRVRTSSCPVQPPTCSTRLTRRCSRCVPAAHPACPCSMHNMHVMPEGATSTTCCPVQSPLPHLPTSPPTRCSTAWQRRRRQRAAAPLGGSRSRAAAAVAAACCRSWTCTGR